MRPKADWFGALRAPGATAAAVRLRFPPLGRRPLILATTRGHRRVACVSKDALEYGVRPGMTLAQARRLCDRATVVEYSAATASAAVALFADAFACRVRAEGNDRFMLRMGDECPMDEFVECATAYCANVLRVGSLLKAAVSPVWARVALEYGERCPAVIPPGREAEYLAPTPLSWLPWLPVPGIDAFARQWSVFTVGDLSAVPAPLVQKLLGPNAVDLCCPGLQRRSKLTKPFEARVEVSPPTNATPALRRAALSCVDRAWGLLPPTTQAAARLEVSLRGSDGRVARRRTVMHPEPEDPVNLGRAAIDLINQVRMRHAVDALTVRVWPGCSRGRQLSLFPTFSSMKSERLGRALSELASRFGAGAVTRANLLVPSAA